MADEISKKRIIYYENTVTADKLTDADTMFVDHATQGTRKMHPKAIIDSTIKSSGVSVTADTYSSTITDVNNQPVNTVYAYAAGLQSSIANLPSNNALNILHYTYKYSVNTNVGQVMIATERSGENPTMYFRTTGGSPATWGPWQKMANDIDLDGVETLLNDVKNDLNDIYATVSNNISASKNLFYIPKQYLDKDLNGIVITLSDDNKTYVVNGTSASNVYIPIIGQNANEKSSLKANIPYTFSIKSMLGFTSSSRFSARYNYVIDEAQTSIVTQNTSNRVNTITFTDVPYLQILIYKNDVYDNARFVLQVEEGETATDYELPSGLIDREAREQILSLKNDILNVERINNSSFDYGIKYPKSFEIVELLENSSPIKIVNGTSETITDIRYRHCSQSYLLKNDGANSNMEFRFSPSSPIENHGIQEYAFAMYIEDVSNISNFRFDTMSSNWKKTINDSLVNGWNIIRVPTNGTGMGSEMTEDKYRLIINYKNSSIISPVYLCSIQAIKPPHASLIFVDDAGYTSFYDYAYPLLTEIGCPVTWALECNKIEETRATGRGVIGLDELTLLEDDGISEFSWHGYDGELTANMTAEETAKYNLKCIRFLSRRGSLNGKVFRAVWPGNHAPNYQLAILDLDAAATYDATNGYTRYPYPDKYNIPRNSLQIRDTTYIDNMFSVLEKTHCIVYVYTHGIIDSTEFDPNEQDMRLDMLQYFISKMQVGINAGWLKTTTYNRLEKEYEN